MENFLEIAKHIYSTEIPLERTDNDSLHDTFLDLDITVVHRRFCFKVFHQVDLFDFEVISFPFFLCRKRSYNLSKITKTEL